MVEAGEDYSVTSMTPAQVLRSNKIDIDGKELRSCCRGCMVKR